MASEAAKWNATGKHPQQLKTTINLDEIFKNTSIEGTIALWYGLNGGVTYLGNGKVNLNIAIVNGAGLELSINKTFSTPAGGRVDGVYAEFCASGGKVAYAGACAGSNGKIKKYIAMRKLVLDWDRVEAWLLDFHTLLI